MDAKCTCSGMIKDTSDYYSQLMDEQTECPVIIVRTAEEDRYGVDLPEYFTDMGEFLILLFEL